ncbi:XRE family transcriptional regulator [Sinorhizobium meliloti]|uniref:helix-turn-helix transcriptional regulator n=1 Tax=Rhizobium meliloti TaxID=382 RepID=UPI000FDB7807|nr:helix-turn-helix transcriptional regulator [Sinorhizobium meliloti]RVJ02419.1 XRE family transcriptional regulator [Sinorhizobium meliloti]
MTLQPDPVSYPPRGLSREEAARYIGVSVSKFEAMVKDRRMPKPRQLDRRAVWDRVEIDMAFSSLPHQEVKSDIERALERARSGL